MIEQIYATDDPSKRTLFPVSCHIHNLFVVLFVTAVSRDKRTPYQDLTQKVANKYSSSSRKCDICVVEFNFS